MEDWQIDGKPRASHANQEKATSGFSKAIDCFDKNLDKLMPPPPPPTPKTFKIGRKKMPYAQAKVYAEAIRDNRFIDLVSDGLKEYNVTIAEFQELWNKRSR